MNTLINRLFQKSSVIDETSIGSSSPYQEFLQHFYSQGITSQKLDALKEKISNIDFNPDPTKSSYQLVECYLEIEHYLLYHDVGFLGNTVSLRKELQDFFPSIANAQPFSVLYKNESTEEIALALLLSDYLHKAATDYCGYVSVLEPTFILDKNINLDLLEGNIVHYLSCKRKIREYIDALSIETHKICEKKAIINPFHTWFSQFTNFYQNLKASDKIMYYLPEEGPLASSETIPTTPEVKLQNRTNILDTHQNTPAIASEIDASLYKAMFENMLDGAILFEKSGRVILANERARTFLNLSEENINEQNIFGLLPVEISQKLKEDIEDRTHKKEKNILGKREEIHLYTSDGSLEYYEITISNNYNKGEDTYSVFLKNITKKRDSLDVLSKQMEHVQKAAKAKSTFLSNMSHEIRTPLNVILGLADIIKKSDNEDAEQFKKNIEGINFSAKSLLSIVNDILDFSKIEAGKLSIQSYNYNIRKVITSLAEGFKTKANEKGILLYTEIDENIPDIVVGDQYRLNQILTNLIGNAIKFTHEGDIGVIVSYKELHEGQIEVHFEVKDSGIGISKDKLNHIFDSFYQIEEAGHSKSNGTGLGLAITKELINLQNGTLTASSIEGEGSSFCFRLPLTKSKLQSTEENIKTHKRCDKQLEGLRVLVAEDNTMNQFYIKQLMNRLGIEVDIADNGQEAVDVYSQKQNGYYNLILMDMHMPVLGGVDAIKKIRMSHKDSIKKVPIVMCTADVFPESRKNAIKAGIDFYLTKPVDEDALKEVLFWLVSDEETNLDEVSTPKKEDTHSATVNIAKLKETFDNDEEFIISLLEIFIADTPDDFNSLSTCVERKFYTRASELAHKLKSSFMNLGMTHQGYLLQQIEKNISTGEGVETGVKYFEQFKKIYTKTLLDVNIQLIELKRL
ncbi:ATP-binding protein [uncultured Dokdonia sp.]|uniref:ATP-binding protein n=1 Tax=uncultured Dokdonia sp. TaxID=575653 RepID=UPI0026150DCC|nr:ATP-binding protein [uncultured Dokdonia sp.]